MDGCRPTAEAAGTASARGSGPRGDDLAAAEVGAEDLRNGHAAVGALVGLEQRRHCRQSACERLQSITAGIDPVRAADRGEVLLPWHLAGAR